MNDVGRPRRTLAILLLAALLVGWLAVPAGAVSRYERRVHHLINRERTERGKRALTLNTAISRKARSLARNAAEDGKLTSGDHSSCLACKLRDRSWTTAGENLGTGPTLLAIHRALMDSSPHRHNILNPDFTHDGCGAFRDASGQWWVAQIFWG